MAPCACGMRFLGHTSRRNSGCKRYARAMSTSPPATPSQLGEWLAQTGQAIEEMLWVWDAGSGRVLYVTPAFERFWGHDAQALGTGREALLDRVHAEDRERMRRARAQLEQPGYSEKSRVTLPAYGGKPGRVARL